MLLPDNISPENSVYFNAAWVLQQLQEKSSQDLLELYQNVRKNHQMSFPMYILCLDWLYLLDLAKLETGERVEACF